MQESAKEQQTEQRLSDLTAELQSGTLQNVWKMLNNLHPAEIAELLESLPPAQREIVWELVDPELEGDVLVYVNDEVRGRLIKGMRPEDLVAATDGMDMDDLADIINDLPEAVTQEVLHSMDNQDRARLEAVMSWPEDSAGGLMNIDTITVRADVTLDTVLRYLRMKKVIPEQTDSLIVVNRYDHFLGSLSLSTLLTSDPGMTVAQVMDIESEAIPASTPDREVANLFEKRNLISAPVVDKNNRLLGRITIDDVVDVIRDDADHSLLGMAGLDEEEDMFAPVFISARRRALWLGINLITAFMAAWVIGLFETTLDKVVALAILMPIAASMGGVAGTQTLTLVIRGAALGQIGKSNTRWLMTRELMVGALNGLLWAIVVASIVMLWFKDLNLGLFIGAALVINLVCAAGAGFAIPIVLRRMGIDPVLGGSVVLTTITDIVGYMSFLGLATIFLL
jgi:magnesium transporter